MLFSGSHHVVPILWIYCNHYHWGEGCLVIYLFSCSFLFPLLSQKWNLPMFSASHHVVYQLSAVLLQPLQHQPRWGFLLIYFSCFNCFFFSWSTQKWNQPIFFPIYFAFVVCLAAFCCIPHLVSWVAPPSSTFEEYLPILFLCGCFIDVFVFWLVKFDLYNWWIWHVQWHFDDGANPNPNVWLYMFTCTSHVRYEQKCRSTSKRLLLRFDFPFFAFPGWCHFQTPVVFWIPCFFSFHVHWIVPLLLPHPCPICSYCFPCPLLLVYSTFGNEWYHKFFFSFASKGEIAWIKHHSCFAPTPLFSRIPVDGLEDELATIDNDLKEVVANNPQHEAYISPNLLHSCWLWQSINGFNLLLHSKWTTKRKGLRVRSRRQLRLQRKTRNWTPEHHTKGTTQWHWQQHTMVATTCCHNNMVIST